MQIYSESYTTISWSTAMSVEHPNYKDLARGFALAGRNPNQNSLIWILRFSTIPIIPACFIKHAQGDVGNDNVLCSFQSKPGYQHKLLQSIPWFQFWNFIFFYLGIISNWSVLKQKLSDSLSQRLEFLGQEVKPSKFTICITNLILHLLISLVLRCFLMLT